MSDNLQIIGSRSAGGAERFYIRLVNSLRTSGIATEAAIPPTSVLLKDLDPAVPRHTIRMRSVWDILAMQEIRRVVARTQPRIVQTWMGRATRLTRLSRQHEAVHVARLGGYYNLHGYRHADAWVGNTKGICDYLVSHGLPGDRVFHIGNFYEPEFSYDPDPEPKLDPDFDERFGPNGSHDNVRVRLGIGTNDLLVLSTGRLHPNKGFPDLLNAISLIPSHIGGRRLVFAILGDGPLHAILQQQATDLGIDDRVVWGGWIDHPDPYYQTADLFICPSRHEPLGNVILEAWYYGVPVVSTRNQGAEELMTDGYNGILAPLRDPPALANAAIGALTLTEQLRSELIRNGRETLETHHSRRSVTASYLELYEQLSR